MLEARETYELDWKLLHPACSYKHLNDKKDEPLIIAEKYVDKFVWFSFRYISGKAAFVAEERFSGFGDLFTMRFCSNDADT